MARKAPTKGTLRVPSSTVEDMSLDPSLFRQVLGHFPTGVTVVTATRADGTPVGFTIGSFTSVSLDPPLVGFLPMSDSERWQAIEATGSFCVNVLGCLQGDLCWQFAKSSVTDPFDGVDWHPSPITGSPILDGAIAWIDCSIERVVEAGDHQFVMGRVLEMEHAHPDLEPVPLLFYRGKVGRFALDG
jgi:flavin reductase (DIM6/NTAB) family NADH-FMN oxidoreductase RutF